METVTLGSWYEFRLKIDSIMEQYGTRIIYGDFRSPIFRGQSDSTWPLTTTLERYSPKDWSIFSYYALIRNCVSQIESFTQEQWNIEMDLDKVDHILKEKLNDIFLHLPSYEYWIYLRHHGFPSPLLDWSFSPYLAVFFAFNEFSRAEFASAYVFIKAPSVVQTGWFGAPTIHQLGPHVKTHKRHFLQQACYTVATKIENSEHRFICHEEVFKNRDDGRQDVLIKVNIPRSERSIILGDLQTYNINEFSLIQSEEALIRTLAINKLVKEES